MGLPVRVLRQLVCPGCGHSLSIHHDTARRYLLCESCETEFSMSSSMVSFVGNLKEQEATTLTFGYEWKAFLRGAFDKDDVFGLRSTETKEYFLSRVGLTQSDLAGLKILDIGTGSGRIPKSLQDTGCHIYAVDIHKNLHLVADELKNFENVSFFQADLFRLPFKDGFADIAWSSGVIHHTPNPAKAFAAIARKVKPGGRIFLSVYSKDLHHYRLLRRLMPFARHLPVACTYFLATLVAVPAYLAFNTALFLVRLMYHNRKPPYRFLGFEIENTRSQSYRGILLNIFDQIHPHYQSEHSVDEVRGWFTANGLSDVTIVESVGMVGVRGIKSRQPNRILAGAVAVSGRHTE